MSSSKPAANTAATNGSIISTSVNVKELKNKFSELQSANQKSPVPKSPTRVAPKSPIKVVPKSPSANTPTKKEFALGKSNIYIEDKSGSGYKPAPVVTQAKPGSKVSELAKMYPHPHPVSPVRQQSANQQTYARSNSKPEAKEEKPASPRAGLTVNVRAPVQYAENVPIRTPTTPVTVVAWEDRQADLQITESVKDRAARLHSTVADKEKPAPSTTPPRTPLKRDISQWNQESTGSQLMPNTVHSRKTTEIPDNVEEEDSHEEPIIENGWNERDDHNSQVTEEEVPNGTNYNSYYNQYGNEAEEQEDETENDERQEEIIEQHHEYQEEEEEVEKHYVQEDEEEEIREEVEENEESHQERNYQDISSINNEDDGTHYEFQSNGGPSAPEEDDVTVEDEEDTSSLVNGEDGHEDIQETDNNSLLNE